MDEKMSLLDKLIGTEGAKVDVTVNLSPEIYLKLFVTIVGAVFVSVIGAKLIGDVIQK